MVHGNNDRPAAVEVFRRAGVTIHRREQTIGDYRFIGFGGDGTAPHDVELAEGEALELHPGGAFLLTHLPPPGRRSYSPDVRRDTPRLRNLKAGPESPLSQAPLAHICGHVHHTEGVAYVGETKVIKLRAAMWNRCALLDLASLAAKFVDLEPGARVVSSRPRRT